MSIELLSHLKILELSMKAKDEKIANLEAELHRSTYEARSLRMRIVTYCARTPSDSVGLLTALGWVAYPVLFLAGMFAGLLLSTLA